MKTSFIKTLQTFIEAQDIQDLEEVEIALAALLLSLYFALDFTKEEALSILIRAVDACYDSQDKLSDTN
jgi:hypothetical protein